ncbi:MAG TPA: GNAT family N-acetyltransferase [Polyangiaceae bacterium]|nr:GNAT family N-acetyltransferase [Polyangiaceae bacterium]
MKWRRALLTDAGLLARMNADLIRDEGHSNPMTVEQLEDRMRGWLQGEYSAVLFEADDQIVAYALYRDNEGRGIYLRQFFVLGALRRRGLGRQSIAILKTDVLEKGTRITVDVLTGNPRALTFWRAVGFADYALTLDLST